MAEDYYTVLGVSRDADEEAIRRAYRELARKHHPDLNPDDKAAKDRFQEVTRAFEVLGDAEKRQQYDRFGPAFESFGGGGPGAGPRPGGPGFGGTGPGGFGNGGGVEFDLNDLFGGGAPGGGGGGGFADLFKQFGGGAAGAGRGSGPSRGGDIEHEITIPFATAVTGGEAALSLARTGGKQETLTVKIPAGVDDGRKIRLRGQGNPGAQGGPAGDILLTVRVAPHPVFRRTGKRLDVVAPITLGEAAGGAKIDIPTPKGVITLSVPAGATSGQKLRVKGHGVDPHGPSPGDLYAELQVQMPPDLTDADRETLVRVSEGYPQTPRDSLRW